MKKFVIMLQKMHPVKICQAGADLMLDKVNRTENVLYMYTCIYFFVNFLRIQRYNRIREIASCSTLLVLYT